MKYSTNHKSATGSSFPINFRAQEPELARGESEVGLLTQPMEGIESLVGRS